MILEGPEKKSAKSEVNEYREHIGDQFPGHFCGHFLQDVEKSESSNPAQIQAGKSTGWELFSS